ncbi:MAG: hypothetical protein F9K35_06185 [Burkholderiaceae bacterium]|nr:MAG: hypothetical protein F9K35_06185 [Burkholderiaceae bacterium]
MTLDQIAIAALGAVAVWLSQARSEAARRWACITGLCSQPFLFYAVWNFGLSEAFVFSALYAVAWLHGLWVYWLRPRPATGVGTIQLPPESRNPQ